jgi:hypothetical protein
MKDIFNLESFRILSLGSQAPSPEKSSPPRKLRSTEAFFFARMPLWWMQEAAGTPGKGLHVAIAICHLKNLKRSDTFPLSQKIVRSFRVGRGSAYGALGALESAGLISVLPRVGRCPEIRVLGLTGRIELGPNLPGQVNRPSSAFCPRSDEAEWLPTPNISAIPLRNVTDEER